MLIASTATSVFNMTGSKKKEILAIDSYDFKSFTRSHLPKHFADALLMYAGITSYIGLLHCDELASELIAVSHYVRESDGLLSFLSYDLSSNQIKPGILRVLNSFREQCRKKNAIKI